MINILGIDISCETHFKIPWEKCLDFDKGLKNVYKSFVKKFGTDSQDFLHILDHKEYSEFNNNSTHAYSFVLSCSTIDSESRNTLLTIANIMHELEQYSSTRRVKLLLLNSIQGHLLIIVNDFNPRLAGQLKSQAVLEKL